MGSTRAAVAIYIVPVVAILLGALLNDESIHVAALLGTGLVLTGAYLTSKPRPEEPADRGTGTRAPRN